MKKSTPTIDQSPAKSQSKPSAIKKYPGLYLIASKVRQCYKISFSHEGKLIQEYFHFGKRRKKSVAKQLAITRWVELRAIYPVHTRASLSNQSWRATDSGIVGVSRVTKLSKGHAYTSWRAVWKDRDFNRKQANFSVNKFGEDRAKELAIKARQRALKKLKYCVRFTRTEAAGKYR